MLTGLLALAKLLPGLGRRAMEYASLLVGRARGAAKEAAVVLTDLAKFLLALGRTKLDELPQLGLAVLQTLVPPELIRELIGRGRALLSFQNLTFMPVHDLSYAQAFGGARMRYPFGVIIAEEGKPVAMAVTSERLPSGFTIESVGRTAAGRAEMQTSVEKTLEKIDDLLRGPKINNKSALDPIVISAQRLKDLNQRLTTHLTTKLQEVAYDAFRELRAQGRRFSPAELGRLVHTRMKTEIAAVVGTASPGLQPYTEKTIKTIYEDLARNPSTAATLAPNAKKVLEEPIVSIVARRPDVMDIIGIEKTASARTSKAVARALKDRFGWTTKTTAGSLQCDLGLAEANAKRFVSVDWSSSTNYELHERTWSKISTDLKREFKGDVDGIAAAYRKVHNGGVPKDVADGLKKLTNHAVRETVIRRVILEQVLGSGWSVSSHEMLYRGLDKLYEAEAVGLKALTQSR